LLFSARAPLHFRHQFLVSLFDAKLSRPEIDPTNFLQRSSRPPPPGCPLDCSRECIETGQGMIDCKRANGQIQRPTEFDSVVQTGDRRRLISSQMFTAAKRISRAEHRVFYKPVKLLRIKNGLLRGAVAKTRLNQSRKSKES